MFAIQIHGGFMIKDFMPQFRNCSVTNNIAEAKKFPTAGEAKQFIIDHHMEGTNKKTNKVIPA